MRIRNWLAGLLALCLLMSSAACAETGILSLPGDTEIIEQEAFRGVTSIDKVILPEGAKEIRDRAFADSSVRTMNLPESIEYIAEDAFDDCEKLTVTVPRDSYAHHYAFDQNLRYTIIEPETGEDDEEDAGYVIHYVECVTEILPNLPKPNRYFLIDADMPEFCDMEVRFYDEEDPNGEPVQYCCEDIDEMDIRDGRILFMLPYEAYFPDYFILDVRMIRRHDQKQLGETYITYDYTKRHAEIMGKTQEDYVGREVISCGDYGYVVLEEGVIRAEGVKVSDGYMLTPPCELKKGDMLYLDLGDKTKAVKVKSFEDNGDGTVTVASDEDISLSDVYARMDIRGYMQPAAGSGFISSAATAGKLHVIPLDPSFTSELVTVKGTADVSVLVDITHDKDEDFFGIECWVEGTAGLEISLTGGFSTRDDLDENPFELALGPAIDLEIPKVDIGAELGVFFPLNLELEVGGKIFVNAKEKIGFSCNSDDKRPRIIKGDHKESNAYAEVVGSIVMDIGPELRLDIDITEALETGIHGQIGVRAEGNLEGLQYGGSTSTQNAGSKHACLGCLNCDINFFGEVGATLKGKVSEKIEFTMFDNPILEPDPYKIGDAYWSFLNEKESIYGGNPSFGFTECKNHKYRTNVHTYDMDLDELTGIPVTLTGDKILSMTGRSPTQAYLYPGTYKASALINGATWDQGFMIEDKAKDVFVYEKEATLEGIVSSRNESVPLPGTSVLITLPDGSIRQTTTDQNGRYFFDRLPGGKFDITFSAENHESQTINQITVLQGGRSQMNITLSAGPLPEIRAWLSPALVSAGEPAVATDTKGNEIEQEILFSASGTYKGFYGTCASELLVENDTLGISYRIPIEQGDDCHGGFLYGADLGDGTYTYLVTWGTDYYVNKTKCVVLRDGKNGMTKALDFTFSGETDNVYGLGKEYDGYIDYNNIQPSDKDIGYGVFDTDGEFKKKYGEPYTLLIHTNEADFTNGGWMITYEVDSYYQLVDGQLVIVDQKIYKKY